MTISDAERQVMEALWDEHPLGADDIIGRVADRQGWSPATVKTLLNRLLKKKAITAETEGRRYLYTPVLLREDYLTSESRGLLDRLFDGRLAPLVSHFQERDALSDEDVRELRALLEELENDDR